MATSNYFYDGMLWTPCATVHGENSFFHSAFGDRTNEDEAYFDKHANFRRRRWLTFLTYFENETMPAALADALINCFSANDKYKLKSIKDKHHLESYVLDIIAGHCVIKEEVYIISTLENMKIILLSKEEPNRVVVVNPNPEILGNYSNDLKKPIQQVVLCMEGCTFSRLEPIDEGSASKSVEVIDNEIVKLHQPSSCLWRYKKGGSAGSKGVEFQVKLLTVVLLNSLRKLNNWKLSTENKKAGKFDDAVLERSEGNLLIQTKHKEKTKRITFDELLSSNSKNDDFSLPKYFISYQEIKNEFKGNNIVVICTNAGIHEKVLEFLESHRICSKSILYCADDNCFFYTFNKEFLHHLKDSVKIYLEKNYQNRNIDQTVLSDENLKDFLERLQFYFNYPLGNNIEKVADKLVSFLKCSANFKGQASFSETYGKVMEWFQRKDGIYLTESIANAMFVEIESDRYLQMLDQYNAFFQENLFSIQHKTKLYYVNAEGGLLLQELKVYWTLRNNKSKIIYASSKDGTELKKIIEAFELPFYTLLIISCPKDTVDEFVISNKLRTSLDRYDNKKIILIGETNHSLVKQISKLLSSACITINQSITFKDFSREFQEKLLKKRVTFQGSDVSIQELLEIETDPNWINELSSEVLEKLVLGEQIKVGTEVRPVDQHIFRYYVDRTFKREVERIEHDENVGRKKEEIISEEKIYQVNEKLVLIADAAGTGKSTVLSHLAVTIKEKNPLKWVIFIKLSSYTRILRMIVDENRIINIIDMLDFKDTSKLSNQLERILFSIDRKVVLLIDGIDEISPDYTEIVLTLLDQCQKGSNFDKVFVTTRLNMTKELESILLVKPFTLLPFTRKRQIRFLTNYWAYNLKVDNTNKKKCKKYAIMLLETTSTWTKLDDEREGHFAAIPLLIRMLADIFQSSYVSEESTWQGCKEYLKENDVMPKLPGKNNITQIYKMFIEKKRNVFRSKANPSSNTAANEALVDQFEECLAQHRIFALDEILHSSQCELFSDYQQTNVETKLLKMGIVQKSDNSIYFVHRSFAEYFVAESLLRELQLQMKNQSPKFQKFFFDEILLKVQFKVVRAFFDNFLKERIDNLPSNIFKSYLSLRYDIDLEANYNLIHVLAEEGCVAILQLLFKCIDFEFEFDFEDFSANTLIFIHSLVGARGVDICDLPGNTPIDYATVAGHFEMVKFLIARGANLNPFNTSVLTIAIENNRRDILKLIIQHGVNLKMEEILFDAISTNHANMVTFILDSMLKSNKWNEIGPIIPYTFAYLGRLKELKHLVKKGLNVNSTVQCKETIIFGATRGGQLETIKYLIDQGAHMNSRNVAGNTLLHLTDTNSSWIYMLKFLTEETGFDIYINHHKQDHTDFYNIAKRITLDIVEFLVGHGSDVHARNNNGETPLHSAVLKGQLDTVKYFVTRHDVDVNATDKYGNTPLHLAAAEGKLGIIKLLLEYHADFNIRNSDGATVLHTAAFWGKQNLIKYLIKLGADINAINNKGSTALHSAVYCGNLHTVEYLVKFGADVSVKDNKCCTALHLSALNDKRDIVKFLSDVDTNIRGKEVDILTPMAGEAATLKCYMGKTTLHFAAEKGDLDTIKYLWKLGVNLNTTDRKGQTSLHYAASKGQLEAVKYLVQLGSDINITDNYGLTTLHYAAREGHQDLVEFLVECGVGVNIRGNRGLTAFHFAAQEGYLGVVKYLLDHDASILPCI